jgi:hypothetical protein
MKKVILCAFFAAILTAEENKSLPQPYDANATAGKNVYEPTRVPVNLANEVEIQRGSSTTGVEGKAIHNYTDQNDVSFPENHGGH